MRRPAVVELRRQPPVSIHGGHRVSSVATFASPVGGWNARDPLAAMKNIDAVQLQNWFPRVSDCAIRGGCQDHVTGFAARPKTLMLHSDRTGTNKMFAATNSGIFDVSSAGAVGASVLARTEGYHNWTQIAVSGANYLIAPNGVDKPAYFDGTTWTAVDNVSVPALTGVTTTNLVAANAYKRRLYFLEKNKLNFWYLAADAIGGALTEFLLAPLCVRGGYTMAMGTWSLDAGNGPDDYAVFITSEGEAIVFVGSNPSDPADWSLVGIYYVGMPLGRKCLKKYGGDLIVLTEMGAFPLSRALRTATIDQTSALSNKIENAFVEAGRTLRSNIGWTIEVLPSRGALLVNVPVVTGGTTAKQYVMNTTNRSWCEFTGWNASDLANFNGELYFADATKVAKAWTGTFSDYGAAIVAYGQTAFTNLKDARIKDWKMFRPLLRTNGPIQFNLGMTVDFAPPTFMSAATYAVSSGAIWDTSLWDVGIWAAGLESVLEWRTPGVNPGEWGSGILQIATTGLEIQWAANDYLYEIGGVIG